MKTNATQNLDPWFCIRCQPKHEHIAAAHLRQHAGVEVFLPRYKVRKTTRSRVVTVIENLFPNYLFARFDVNAQFWAVQYTYGVSTIVHFRDRIPTIEPNVIAELQAHFDSAEMPHWDMLLQPGDGVILTQGAFRGLNAVVLKVLAPQERVSVLMEILGRQAVLNVSLHSVVREDSSKVAVPC
ncbi:MAG: transcriptional activator RfaH [Verrucomicrobiota bacterium]